MFHQGSLLFVRDFDFTTINPVLSTLNQFRDKFIFILENQGNTVLLCCFTTTFKTEPEFTKIAKIGCNKNHFKYSVFHFDSHNHFCNDTNFKFNQPTFVVGNKGQVFGYDLPKLCQEHQIKGKLDHKGTFDKRVVFDILHCLINSPTLEEDQLEELHLLGEIVYSELEAAKGIIS